MKISKIPPLFLPPLIMKNFSFPRISLSSKIQSPSFTKGGMRYENCTSYLKTIKKHLLFLKLISTERLSILHFDLHCNKRDEMSSLIYNRRPPPLSFLSYLYGVVKPTLNWSERNESSSFVSEIRKISTVLSSVY